MKTFPKLRVCALLALPAALWPADWLTDGGDVRRTNWQKDERILTKSNVKEMRLLWKTKLDNEPRQMHSLLEPLVIGSVKGCIGRIYVELTDDVVTMVRVNDYDGTF